MTPELPSVRDVPAATAAQMAEVDRIASEELGIALEALMESAAHQVARAVWLVAPHPRVVALGGSGNNGGDALAAARWLAGWGAEVTAVLAGPADRLRPLARRQHDTLAACGIRVIDASAGRARADDALAGCDVVIDGLLGYSATGAPRGAVADLIAALARVRAPVVAVDLPSGIEPDTGDAPGAVVRAAITVTLALPKPGLFAPRARERVGTLLLADIGIPPAAFAHVGIDTRSIFAAGDLLRVTMSA